MLIEGSRKSYVLSQKSFDLRPTTYHLINKINTLLLNINVVYYYIQKVLVLVVKDEKSKKSISGEE